MTAAIQDRIHLTLASGRFSGGARQRWQSRHLVARPVMAARLGMVLGGHDVIGHAEVNPRTGRILLDGVKASVAKVESLIRAALHRLLVEEIQDDLERRAGGDGGSGDVLQYQARNGETEADGETRSWGSRFEATEHSGAFRELVERFPPKRRELLTASTFSLTNTVVNFAPELALIAIVNVVNGQKLGLLSKIGLSTMRGQVLAIGGLAGAAFAFELLVERKKRRKWRNMARKMEHEIRTVTYDHLQRMDMAHIDAKSSGEHINLLWDSMGKVRNFTETGADDMLQRVFTAVIIVASLAYVSPALALTTLAPLPIIMAGSRLVAKRVETPYETLQHCEEMIQKFLSTNLSDLASIKSYTAEDRETDKLRTLSSEVRDTASTAIETSSRYTDLMRLLISISFALSVVIGGFLVARKSITPAMFTLILFFVPKLLVRMEGMGEGYDQYKLANQSARAIMDELGASPTIRSGSTHLERDAVKGEIVFTDLDFGYREEHLVLKNFSLTIPARASVAFVGATGSGKSAIVKLLSRFYDPVAGPVRLDGLDVREVDLSDLRRNVAMVSQETFLFDASVAENILFGRPEATEAEVIAAAKAAEAHGFITELPQGYDTTIGERGKALSGGQRQRIAIARAILKAAPILVFDEATSAVDNETEAAIQRSIDALAQDRTAILIAHRLSTVRNADSIHVMSEGHIVESGTHEELLARDGVYAALWRVQTGEAVYEQATS